MTARRIKESMSGFNGDRALYGLIGGLTALVGAPDPLTWRTWASVCLAALVAVKAKGSRGKKEGEEE